MLFTGFMVLVFYVPPKRTIFSQCRREAVLGTFSPCNLSRLSICPQGSCASGFRLGAVHQSPVAIWPSPSLPSLVLAVETTFRLGHIAGVSDHNNFTLCLRLAQALSVRHFIPELVKRLLLLRPQRQVVLFLMWSVRMALVQVNFFLWRRQKLHAPVKLRTSWSPFLGSSCHTLSSSRRFALEAAGVHH